MDRHAVSMKFMLSFLMALFGFSTGCLRDVEMTPAEFTQFFSDALVKRDSTTYLPATNWRSGRFWNQCVSAGHARIGRVTFSATRKTIYYLGRKLRSLKGSGYKANYINVESGLEYWISNCKRDGNDTLYPGTVEIDDDAREEYWTTIRSMPQNVHLTKFRSEGKYAKRRPS